MGRIFGFIFGACGLLCLIAVFGAWSDYSDLGFRATEIEEQIALTILSAYVGATVSAFFFCYVAFSIDALIGSTNRTEQRVYEVQKATGAADKAIAELKTSIDSRPMSASGDRYLDGED